MAFQPLADGQGRVELGFLCPVLDHEAVDKTAHDSFVGDGESTTLLEAVADGRDDAQRAAEDRFKRPETDIDDLKKAVVPRGEMNERWAGQRAHDADIQRQFDELRGRNDALYGPWDELARLNREVGDLRGRPPR